MTSMPAVSLKEDEDEDLIFGHFVASELRKKISKMENSINNLFCCIKPISSVSAFWTRKFDKFTQSHKFI